MSILTLASQSSIRATLLRNAGIEIDTQTARIDEDAIRESMQAENASPRDIADALAEQKALRVANRLGTGLVLGCDQILELNGTIFAKPSCEDIAKEQLRTLRGQTHNLLSAAVLYKDGQPIWRYVATSRLTMRDFSDDFLAAYVAQNWSEIRHCVGCYQIEGPGIRLFSRIEGDIFAIQGLPLLELLTVLTNRKDIPG